jgi:hypothetical protein
MLRLTSRLLAIGVALGGHIIGGAGPWTLSPTNSVSVGVPCRVIYRAQRFLNGSALMTTIAAVSIPINPFSWLAGTVVAGMGPTCFGSLIVRAFVASMALSPYMCGVCARLRGCRRGHQSHHALSALCQRTPRGPRQCPGRGDAALESMLVERPGVGANQRRVACARVVLESGKVALQQHV